MTNPELRNLLLEVTGPELLTFDECVQAIAKASGREIRSTPVPVEAYLEGAKAEGLPEDIAWLINELFENILDGRNESTTKTVQNVLWRPARSFGDYVTSVAPMRLW